MTPVEFSGLVYRYGPNWEATGLNYQLGQAALSLTEFFHYGEWYDVVSDHYPQLKSNDKERSKFLQMLESLSRWGKLWSKAPKAWFELKGTQEELLRNGVNIKTATAIRVAGEPNRVQLVATEPTEINPDPRGEAELMMMPGKMWLVRTKPVELEPLIKRQIVFGVVALLVKDLSPLRVIGLDAK